MSLLAPLFLLGLLASVIPWWLHRLSASNPPRQDFSSTRFLDPDQSTSSKKKRTRFWPLLVLRFLFLALLALLFAEPVIERLKLTGATSVRHILVIDTSLSQSLDGRWQRTLDIARAVLDSAGSGDEAVVVTAADRFTQLQSTSNTVESAREQLGTIEPGNSRLDYGRIGSALSAAVADGDISNHLHIVTDTQASAMPERFASLAVDKVDNIRVYSSASDNDRNISITGKLDYANDNAAAVTAIVNNYGDASSTTLSVTSNGTTLATQQIDLDSNQSTVHQFTDLDLTSTGSQLELQLSPTDSLAADDTWLIPLPTKERTEITLLTNDTQPAVATTYFAAALESDPRFVARQVDATRFSVADSGNLIIVPDASVISDRTASQLSDFVNNGGNLLIAVGNKRHSSEVASLLNMTNTGTSGPSSANNSVSVGSIDKSHHVTTGLADNWRAISIINYQTLETRIADRSIIELSNGSPLLIEKRMGAGKMLLLATALDTEWSDLPTESVFVAFVMKAVDFLGGDTATTLYRSTGDVVSVASGTQLLSPDGQPLREISSIAQRESIALDASGIYQLSSSAGTQSIAVNSDSRESDITPIDQTTLDKWQQIASNSEESQAITQQTNKNSQRGFWTWLLPLLLLLAILESLYSHRHLWIRREV